MWIELEEKGTPRLLNIETGTLIYVSDAIPAIGHPHSLVVANQSVAYFKQKSDALEALRSIRKVIGSSNIVQLAFDGQCDPADPFKALGFRSPFMTIAQAQEHGLVEGNKPKDWLERAKELGVDPQPPKEEQ